MQSVTRLVAAVVLTAATSLVLPSAPASAAACSTAKGVTVVVDFHELGGGVQQVCDSGGAGKAASTQFEESGFELTRVQSQPGFVCRVQGKPASDPCQRTPPADAYWGLWWSDGKSGSWSYATQGVDSLKVPEGGYVALSWNGSSAKSPPGARATAHQSQPSPSPSSSSPQPQPSSGPSGGGSHASPSPGTPGATGTAGGVSVSPSASASGGATPSGSASRKAGHKPSASASESASASPSGDPTSSFSMSPEATPEAATDPADPSGDGLPPWVAPVAIGLLFAAAAGTAVVRHRRRTPGP